MKVLCIVLLTATSLMLQCGTEQRVERRTILVGGIAVTVEVSDSPEERMKGLMFRRTLDWNEGMFFVFDKEETLSFWMLNTPVPLSIAFIDDDGVIIDIQDMDPYDATRYRSKGRARYALEMNRGWFTMNGICVGERVLIDMN